MDPTPTLFGLLVGFLVGLTGVGGGSLMTPFLLAVVGVPAGLLGVATLEWIEGSFDAETVKSIMITIIAITLVVVGGSLIFRNFLPEREEGPKPGVWDGKSRMSRRRRAYTVVFGALGGYLVGLTSIGSGSVMAVILLLLYPLAPAVVVGTDIA